MKDEVLPEATAELLRRAALTEEQAEAIFESGRDAVVFALLELTKRLAEARGAEETSDTKSSTPSGMIPVYEKPPAKPRQKRPGAKAGHRGARRRKPERIDRRETHQLPCCPDCGGRLKRTGDTRTRYVEEIPDIQPEVTEHTIHRDWCTKCKKRVEPKVPDALPKATLGNRVLVLSAWLHYSLGNTLSQIVEVFNFHLQMKITKGGLVQMWYRLQAVLFAWYERIQAEALDAAVLHADETGWRVNGKTHWLWCFTTRDLTYYMIDRSRGSPALKKFFLEEFQGILVSDFWGAYNAVACALRQTCLAHLLRDLHDVEHYKRGGDDWPAFAKKLRRLLADGIRLWRRRDELTADKYQSLRNRLHKRLAELIETPWDDAQAKRLVKRLRRHQNDLFTFVDHTNVPFDNNHAERIIRPAVIIRKNSYGNRSDRGADCQSVLMSVFQTLKQRGHEPIRTICQAIATFLKTGQLPPLPGGVGSEG